MNAHVRTIAQTFSLMVGVYLAGLYFTYIFPAFSLFFWMSPLMHTLGGLVTAFTLHQLYLVYGPQYRVRIEPLWVYMTVLVALVVWVGVVWEIYEYLQDIILGTVTQLGIGDALLDLVMDTFGATLFCLFFLKVQPKKSLRSGGKSKS
jgi:hypothetical protein